MRSWRHGLLLLGLSSATATANEMRMNQENDNRQLCAGMYSKNDWGGPVDPHILVKFVKQDGAPDQDEIASMIIFEWKDYDLIGVSVYTSGQRLG